MIEAIDKSLLKGKIGYTKITHEDAHQLKLPVGLTEKELTKLWEKVDIVKAKYTDAYIKYLKIVNAHNFLCNELRELNLVNVYAKIVPLNIDIFADCCRCGYYFDAYTCDFKNNTIYIEEVSFNPYNVYTNLKRTAICKFDDEDALRLKNGVNYRYMNRLEAKVWDRLEVDKQIEAIEGDDTMFGYEKQPLIDKLKGYQKY